MRISKKFAGDGAIGKRTFTKVDNIDDAAWAASQERHKDDEAFDPAKMGAAPEAPAAEEAPAEPAAEEAPAEPAAEEAPAEPAAE